MADIQVTSELTLDASNFMQVLGQAQQSLDQFAQKGMSISPTFDLTNWQASLAQMQQMAVQQAQQIQQTFSSTSAMVTIGLDLTKADAMLQAWLATVQNVTLNMTAPNAVQIGTDIGNAAASAFQSAISGMTWPSGGGGGGGGSGGGSSGGGGGLFGGRRGGMMGMGRLLMPLMVAHQAIRSAEIWDEYHEKIGDAGGNREKELEEDMHRKKEQDSLFFGLGRVARGIGENLPGASMTMAQEHTELKERQYDESVVADRQKTEKLRFDTRMVSARAALTGLDPHIAAEKHEKELAEIDLKEKEELENINTKRKESIGDTIKRKETHKAAIAAQFEESRPKLFDDVEENPAKRRWERDRQAAMDEADDDSSYVQRGKNKQYSAQEDSAKLEARNSKKKAKQEYDRDQLTKSTESQNEIQNSQDSLTAANLRISGKTRESQDFQFRRHAYRPVEELTDKLNREQDPAERARLEGQLRAANSFAQASLIEHSNEQFTKDQEQATRSADKVSDIAASTDIETTRASGQTQRAGNMAYEQSIDKRIRSLQEELTFETDITKQKQIQDELTETTASKAPLLAAREAEQARELSKELKEIRDQTAQYLLQADDKYYEASLEAAKAHYAKMREAARLEDPTGAHGKVAEIDKEEAADKAHKARIEQHKVDDLNEDAIEKRLRREGRGGLADLRSLDKKYEKEMRDATGKPEEQLAILKNKQEDLEALKQGEKYTPSSLEDAWKHIGHGGPGGGLGPGTIDREKVENAAAMRKIQEDLKKSPAHPADDPDLINGGSSGPLIRNPDVNTPDPSHSWLTKFFGDAIQGATGGKNPFEGLSGSAEKLNAAADKIVSGPTLVCADFT